VRKNRLHKNIGEFQGNIGVFCIVGGIKGINGKISPDLAGWGYQDLYLTPFSPG
jgi:hypothetical protein